MQTEFDHIVVGGGSAGCVAAARLAEQPGAQVCVVAAGPADRNQRTNVHFGLMRLTRSNAGASVILRVTSGFTTASSTQIGQQSGGHMPTAASERLTP